MFLTSCRNTQEDLLSKLVKYQSASLGRQLLQTKDKFPLQNHYATLQHNSIKNSTCLFFGLVFTKPVFSHIFFFCKNKQGKPDDISIFKMHLRPGKRKYQILMCALSNCLLGFEEAITLFWFFFWFSNT